MSVGSTVKGNPGSHVKGVAPSSSSGFGVYPDPNLAVMVDDDFLVTTIVTGVAAPWTIGTSGAGAAVVMGGELDIPGICSLQTGTTATGRESIQTNVVGMTFGGISTLSFLTRLRFPTLSTVAETFTTRFGFSDNNAGAATDGAYFELESNGNPNYQCVTANAGVRTTVDSGVAAVAGQWDNLSISGTAAKGIKFRINGVVVATIASNIPNATARAFGCMYTIIKSVGTNVRQVDVDYAQVLATWAASSPRGSGNQFIGGVLS